MTTEPLPTSSASPGTSPDAAPPPSPPARTGRRFGLAAVIAALLAGAVASGGAVWWITQRDQAARSAAAAVRYQCPMHPEIVQDHPGDCPICGMDLEPIGAPAAATAPAAPAAPPARYQCPMHPEVVQDHPGDCPICGMDLERVAGLPPPPKAGATDASGRRIVFYRSSTDPNLTSHTPGKDATGADLVPVYADEMPNLVGAVPGQAVIDIDPARQQLIGLTTAEVTTGPVGGTWRTVGRVAVDETRVRHINLKFGGFVEKIYVDFIGKKVKKGDPLFAIYSPELLAAQEEYLLALRTRGVGSAIDSEALIKGARRKLALWDIAPRELDRIASTGEPLRTLTIYSPVAGVVVKKDVVEGMKLDAGAMPYEIIDLSTVWVLADIYETELRAITDGMPATLILNAYPGREFTGKVLFIDPLLDPRTRTVKVRLAFPNPDGDLRPEMFGEVVLSGKRREGLRIPRDAVVDSGTQKIVFVALGAGKFEPRLVRLGEASEDLIEVTGGLGVGERVVTRANFLIDSESRLRASLSEMTAAAPTADAPVSARVLPGATTPPPADAGAGATAPSAPPPLRPAPPPAGGAGGGHQGHAP